jgi:hypothetical protein
MDSNRQSSPKPIVNARATGENGLPETSADTDVLAETFGRPSSDGRRGLHVGRAGTSSDSYLAWLALSAVMVGGLGALAGWMQRSPRERFQSRWKVESDPGNLTPPHGDKLLRRR